jgi:hypothetical protein
MGFTWVCIGRSQPSCRKPMRRFFCANQDAEKVRQRRSRFAQILNVPQRVRLRSSLAAALLGSLFEHPA